MLAYGQWMGHDVVTRGELVLLPRLPLGNHATPTPAMTDQQSAPSNSYPELQEPEEWEMVWLYESEYAAYYQEVLKDTF